MDNNPSEQQWQILTQGTGYHIRKPDGQVIGSYGTPETGRAHHAFALQEIEALQTALAASEAECERLQESLDANWVTHQRVVKAEQESAALRQQVEGLMKAATRLTQSRIPLHPSEKAAHVSIQRLDELIEELRLLSDTSEVYASLFSEAADTIERLSAESNPDISEVMKLHPAAIHAAERVYHAAFVETDDGWIEYMPSVSKAAVIIDAAIREAMATSPAPVSAE